MRQDRVAAQLVKGPTWWCSAPTRLSLPLPLRDEQDLGAKYRLRYRYTGLRLLLERGGRCWAVLIDWKPRTDPVYVLHESDDIWIG